MSETKMAEFMTINRISIGRITVFFSLYFNLISTKLLIAKYELIH